MIHIPPVNCGFITVFVGYIQKKRPFLDITPFWPPNDQIIDSSNEISSTVEVSAYQRLFY